ncbi:MAG: hypothetical protein KF723_00520 [Rhizobiaceae bacterium]|nr:hypothetical protein [Rhizobiaceae bacterium]
MMRIALAAAAALCFAGTASAGTLHCTFTEPFFNIDYDSATGKIIYTSPNDVDDNGQIKPIIVTETGKLVPDPDWQDHPKLYLKNGDETIVTLTATGQGSDGMSESQFPFEAWSSGREGGCETGKIPAWEIYEFYEDFGIPF